MNKLLKRSVSIDSIEKSCILYSKYYKQDNDLYLINVEDSTVTLDYLCSAFNVTAIIYNEETNIFKYQINFETVMGVKVAIVDKSDFTERKLDGLTSKGFTFEPSAIRDILRFAILEEENAKVITEYSYIGFKDNHFCGYDRDDDRRYVGRFKLEKSSIFDKAELNKLLEGAEYLQLALTISASSAVQGFLGQKLPLSTPLYHFYGDSSQGKTTALLSTSVWGKPTIESGLFSTWNQTELNLMQMMSNNFGVTISLDESSICRFNLTSMLYNLSQGINRQRSANMT